MTNDEARVATPLDHWRPLTPALSRREREDVARRSSAFSQSRRPTSLSPRERAGVRAYPNRKTRRPAHSVIKEDAHGEDG